MGDVQQMDHTKSEINKIQLSIKVAGKGWNRLFYRTQNLFWSVERHSGEPGKRQTEDNYGKKNPSCSYT